MNFRRILRWFLPPIIFEVYHRVIEGRRFGYIWSGIYPDIKNVPSYGGGYDNERVIEDTYQFTKSIIKKEEEKKVIPYYVSNEYNYLPILVSSLFSREQSKIRILDIGGGMGISYIQLKNAVNENIRSKIEYHLVERKNTVKKGKTLLPNDLQLIFHDDIPFDLTDIDIIYMSGVLQYIDNYREYIVTLCKLHAKYIMLTKVPAGGFSSFASLQRNLPGVKVPVWFFSYVELISLFHDAGYKYLYSGTQEREYDQDNFPVEYRIGRAVNLLFGKEEKS